MKRIVNAGIVLFVIYLILSVVIGIIQSTVSEEIQETDSNLIACNEYTIADTIRQEEVQLKHYRSWNKYSFDSLYCLSYTLTSKNIKPSNEFRNQLYTTERVYEKYWRNIYYELYQHDKDLISFLQDSLQDLAVKDSLSRNGLAKLIVSFVQDIPYNYVVPGPCERDDHPCSGNEKFGILSPIEFLYSLSGDCDTRSVLLYSLLKHFEFDPLIMISNEYRHAMIAINLPAAGDHIIYKGKKFYFWETTNTGWLPGMLPPDTNNIAYWKITLDHEYQTLPAGTR